MTIDAHQHFWIYDPNRDSWITNEMQQIRKNFLPEDLEAILMRNAVDGCIAVQADASENETLFLLALADKYERFVRGVVGWVDLLDPNVYERLEEFSQFEALKGIRHIVQDEPDGFMTQPTFVRGVRQLAAFDLTYDILIYPTQLEPALSLVRAVPEVRFVIDHLAKPYIKAKETNTWANFMREMALNPNVYCKLSGLVTEADWHSWKPTDIYPYFDVVFEAFGVDRLMFGSDWPVCLLAADYAQVLSLVTDYMFQRGIAAPDRAFVMGQTAQKFYRIDVGV